jgi:murein DD-endopeptidase MepM/ murein hydrolase activator NlpD
MLVTEGWSQMRSGGRGHQSLDFRAPVGTPFYAVADGVVNFSGVYRDGNTAIEVDSGPFANRYLHHQTALVKKGDRVRKGQQLGFTGFAKSPHLHLDFWGLPSVVSSYLGRFGRPAAMGQTYTFAGKTMTKLPLEPLIPGASYQADVIQGAKEGNVKLYSPISPLLILGAAGLVGFLAYRHFTKTL